jgi:hypothetical protein
MFAYNYQSELLVVPKSYTNTLNVLRGYEILNNNNKINSYNDFTNDDNNYYDGFYE